mgnify:CR=1 FL=1
MNPMQIPLVFRSLVTLVAATACLGAPFYAKADSEKKEESPPSQAKPSKESDDNAPASSSTGYGKTRGLLGPVTVGPMINIVSIPGGAIEAKYTDLLGFGLKFTFLPAITLGGSSIGYNTFDGRARWFPFRGSFFLGAAFGNQSLTASGSNSISTGGGSITTDLNIGVSTLYLTPHLGWRWVWESGFMMGMDFGWQAALATTTTLTLSLSDKTAEAAVKATDDYKTLESNVTSMGDRIGKAGLPSLTLLSMGYLF